MSAHQWILATSGAGPEYSKINQSHSSESRENLRYKLEQVQHAVDGCSLCIHAPALVLPHHFHAFSSSLLAAYQFASHDKMPSPRVDATSEA